MNENDTTSQIIDLARQFGPYGGAVATLVIGYILPHFKTWIELQIEALREQNALNRSRRELNEADAALARAALEANQTRGAAPSTGSPRSVRTSRHDADADLSAPEQR